MTKNVAAKDWRSDLQLWVDGTTRSYPSTGFAPNYDSVSAGTSMMNPATVDRHFTADDQTAASALDGSKDTFDWSWDAGDYTQAPTIDTPDNLTTLVGATVTAPPSGDETVLAIKWNGSTGKGLAPFTCWPPVPTTGGSKQYTKFYCCFEVFVPSNFDANGNGIKICQLTHSGSAPVSNDLFEVYGWDNPPYSYAGALAYLNQGDVKNAAGGSGPGDGLSTGEWHIVEYYAQMESPSGATNGVVRMFLDGDEVWSDTEWTFSGDTGIAYFNQGGIIPYYGGGGDGGPPSDQFMVFGRWFEAFSDVAS